MPLPNLSMNFTPFDPLLAAELNDLVENIESLADGTGLNNSVVTASSLATGAASAYVATLQSTSSTSYTDLTTSGPAVTVTVGANGLLLVGISTKTTPDTSGGTSFMGIALSVGNTLAAADKYAIEFRRDANTTLAMWGDSWLLTGLTPGSTTVTAKYKVGANSASFEHRHIYAVPL